MTEDELRLAATWRRLEILTSSMIYSASAFNTPRRVYFCARRSGVSTASFEPPEEKPATRHAQYRARQEMLFSNIYAKMPCNVPKMRN
jgi:hypothetical protein